MNIYIYLFIHRFELFRGIFIYIYFFKKKKKKKKKYLELVK